jgi:two-component system, LytTR family, sensor kinase
MQNPILSSRQTFYYYLGIWIIVICLHILLLLVSGKVAFTPALSDSIISNLLYAAIGLGLWFPIFFGKSDKEKLISTVVNNIVGCLVTVGFWIGLTYFFLVSIFNTDQSYLDFVMKSLPWRAGIGVLYYEVIILVYYLIIFYRNNKENLVKEAELKALVKESELNSLKSQINPHFLFNSLNSISSLTMIEPAKAQEMIIKLSEFLRYTISNKEEKLTTLDQEIGNINRYLDIEKIRFGKRLHVKQDINDTCRKLKLPGLILQPLLENAVKYGVYDSTEESVVEIRCHCNTAALSIVIRNAWDPEFQFNKGEGIGLKNIRSRMHILYNRDDLLTVRKDQSIFEVQIIFPQL